MRARLSVLYRTDTHPRTGIVSLLLQSTVEPDWSRLPVGYLLETEGGPANSHTKPIDSAFGSLRPGMELRFRLHANPTKKIDTKSGPDGRRRNGKRADLRDEGSQLGWLSRRAELGGFELLTVQARPDVPNVRIEPGDQVVGSRVAARLTFGSVLFEGMLRITDAETFRQTLVSGLGPGKAYGFGLLSVARPPG